MEGFSSTHALKVHKRVAQLAFANLAMQFQACMPPMLLLGQSLRELGQLCAGPGKNIALGVAIT
jgi:hypothetical protein